MCVLPSFPSLPFETCQLGRVSTDDFAAHTDPNILSQPDITTKKLKEMYAEVRKKFNPCWTRKTETESGTHHEWDQFCQGMSYSRCRVKPSGQW